MYIMSLKSESKTQSADRASSLITPLGTLQRINLSFETLLAHLNSAVNTLEKVRQFLCEGDYLSHYRLTVEQNVAR